MTTPLNNIDETIVRDGLLLPSVLAFLAEDNLDHVAFMDRMRTAQRLAETLTRLAFHLGLVQLLADFPVVEAVMILYNPRTGMGQGNLRTGVKLLFVDLDEAPMNSYKAPEQALERFRKALPFNSVDHTAVDHLFTGVPRGQPFVITRENTHDYLKHVMGDDVHRRYTVDQEEKALQALATTVGNFDSSVATLIPDRPRL